MRIFALLMMTSLLTCGLQAQESTLETADGNSDGKVTVAEFIDYASERLQGAGEEVLEAFAKRVDADGNGEIDEDEFAGRHVVLEAMANGEAEEDDEEVVLFDGTDLEQWRGYKEEEIGEGWVVDDGILKFKGSGGDIITKQKFENFEFSFEWLVTEGANSGIMYMVGMGDNAPYFSGPEYQILDNEKHNDGKSSKTSAAALYGLYEAKDAEVKPVGEWNTGKIVINDGQIQHFLNGTKVVDVELGSDDWKEQVNNSKFKDWEKFGVNKEGHLCLQDHGNEVWFRNLKVKVLN